MLFFKTEFRPSIAAFVMVDVVPAELPPFLDHRRQHLVRRPFTVSSQGLDQARLPNSPPASLNASVIPSV